jgi:hypothetical protein
MNELRERPPRTDAQFGGIAGRLTGRGLARVAGRPGAAGVSWGLVGYGPALALPKEPGRGRALPGARS